MRINTAISVLLLSGACLGQLPSSHCDVSKGDLLDCAFLTALDPAQGVGKWSTVQSLLAGLQEVAFRLVHSGWNDGDPDWFGYVGHPIQAALTGFIQIQNDRQGETGIFED